MFQVISILALGVFAFSATQKIDFGTKNKTSDWYALNDGVMGGLSAGQIEYTKNSLIFRGTVSLENNGGFASIRSPFGAKNLAEFETISIKYRAKGQSFGITMAVDQRWFIPNFKQEIPATDGEWKELTFQLTDFKQYRIGEPTGKTMAKDDLAEVIRIGLITNDKKACAFELEVDYLVFQ